MYILVASYAKHSDDEGKCVAFDFFLEETYGHFNHVLQVTIWLQIIKNACYWCIEIDTFGQRDHKTEGLHLYSCGG